MMTKTFKITIGILILLALAAGGVFSVSRKQRPSSALTGQGTPSSAPSARFGGQAAEEIGAEEVEEITAGDIDTSSWKTYRNEEYGFELKYPKNWIVVDYRKELGVNYSPRDSRIVSIADKKRDGMCQEAGSTEIGLGVNKEGKTPRELADALKRSKPITSAEGDLFSEYLFSEDAYSISDGIEAIRIHQSPKAGTKPYECQLYEGDWLYFSVNDHVYVLNIFSEPPQYWPNIKNKAYQIISTLHFTSK